MARVLKWVGIIVGVLVALIIALLLIVPRFVDINKYKPRIESMVTESTGRLFSIGGNIDLTLFPWAGPLRRHQKPHGRGVRYHLG
jgi:AsmA protein